MATFLSLYCFYVTFNAHMTRTLAGLRCSGSILLRACRLHTYIAPCPSLGNTRAERKPHQFATTLLAWSTATKACRTLEPGMPGVLAGLSPGLLAGLLAAPGPCREALRCPRCWSRNMRNSLQAMSEGYTKIMPHPIFMSLRNKYPTSSL